MDKMEPGNQKTEAPKDIVAEEQLEAPTAEHAPPSRFHRNKETFDETGVVRQLLQEKVKNIQTKSTHATDMNDICHVPQQQKAMSEINNALIDDALRNGPRLSLPQAEKQKMDTSSEAAAFESGSHESVDSVRSQTKMRTSPKLSDPEWLFEAAAAYAPKDTPQGSSCTSERTNHGNLSVRMSPTTLENLTKPLLERKEFGEVNAAKEKADDQKFARTTESREYIKHDQEFIIPGPNPMRVPHDELFNAFRGFSNMYLAHEISLSPDFRVERYTPHPESIEGRVQMQLKRAYWDLFNEEIRKEPPEYKRAIQVFKEVKQSILGLLLPHNTKTRDMIDRELDVELISQRIEHDAFTHEDFKIYSEFIIQTLAQLCSPSRDGDIADLKKLDDPAQVFEGILELAEKMKLDIANYYIQQFRPKIVAHCAQYERSKFAEFLLVERRLGEDGLRATRNWLARHAINNRSSYEIFSKAYSELLAIQFDQDPPETLALDNGRFRTAAQKFFRLAIIGAICVTGSGHMHAMVGETTEEFRDLLTKHMKLIITDDDVLDTKKLSDRIAAASEQVLKIMNGFVKQKLDRDMSATESSSLKQCIREIESPDNKVRGLIYRRILDYAEEIFGARFQYPPPVPAGLYSIRGDVLTLVRDLAQAVAHNRLVYGHLYMAILENQVGPLTNFDEKAQDPEFEKVLQLLREGQLKPPQTVGGGGAEAETTSY